MKSFVKKMKLFRKNFNSCPENIPALTSDSLSSFEFAKHCNIEILPEDDEMPSFSPTFSLRTMFQIDGIEGQEFYTEPLKTSHHENRKRTASVSSYTYETETIVKGRFVVERRNSVPVIIQGSRFSLVPLENNAGTLKSFESVDSFMTIG